MFDFEIDAMQLMKLTVPIIAALGVITGCDSNQEAKNTVVETRKKILVADLPKQFLPALDTSSERSLNEVLGSLDALTLDGTVLTVAEVGTKRSATLAAHTIRLINGARIVTNGNLLSLVARKMEFNNSGGIDSFGEDSPKPGPSQKGTDGGRAEIYATKSVFGTLHVSLPGQSGGDGAPGGLGRSGKAGARGSNASDKLVGCGSSGGNGGTGQDGGKGETGNVGGQGGNGGDLILQGAAVKEHDSHFPYLAAPGIGGNGGVGGPGGPGGPGGDGGSGSTFCGGGRAGASGQVGPQGDPGKNGANGTIAGRKQLK
jgi:hypothetical protein